MSEVGYVHARTKRRVRKPPDLTSLFDVMFIVVFVALIRAASAQQALATPPPPVPVKPAPPAPPPIPLDVAKLRDKAIAAIDKDLAGRTPLVIRVAVDGKIVALETGGVVKPLDVPLLEDDKDPDIGVKYLGDRSTELRLCRIAAVHLALPDLSKQLVIVAVPVALADLPHALYDGLHRDLDRCAIDQRGMATLVDPMVNDQQKDVP